MLRLFQASWLVVPAVLATACPMYDDACDEPGDCAGGFTCDASGACVALADGDLGSAGETGAPPRCDTSSDCAEGLECDRYKRCMPPDDASGGMSGVAGAPFAGAGGD